MLETRVIKIGGVEFKVAQPGLGSLRIFDEADKSTDRLAQEAAKSLIEAAIKKAARIDGGCPDPVDLFELSDAELYKVVVMLQVFNHGKDIEMGEIPSP